jgi:hypothetical protein
VAENKESFLSELKRKRDLGAERLAKLNPDTKEYAWEKEQLDDIDAAIKRERGKGFIHPDPASQPPRFDED